jgi:hypothetical protein
MKYMRKSMQKYDELVPSVAFGLTLCMYIPGSRMYILYECCMCESAISRNHRGSNGTSNHLKKIYYGANTCVRLFPRFITYTFPEESSAILVGSSNCLPFCYEVYIVVELLYMVIPSSRTKIFP